MNVSPGPNAVKFNANSISWEKPTVCLSLTVPFADVGRGFLGARLQRHRIPGQLRKTMLTVFPPPALSVSVSVYVRMCTLQGRHLCTRISKVIQASVLKQK